MEPTEQSRTQALSGTLKPWREFIRETLGECSCGEDCAPTPHGPVGEAWGVVCQRCGTSLGTVDRAMGRAYFAYWKLKIEFQEATEPLTRLAAKNPSWTFFMTEKNPESVHQIEDDRIIRLFPGHMVYESSEARDAGETCPHRLILLADGRSAKCVICDGVRELSDKEIRAIKSAQRAGAIFLSWPERMAAMERLKSTKKRRRRKGRKGRAPTGGAEVAAQVPEGFIPVADAAKALGIEAKRLRKMIRDGRHPGVKVGGRVYAEGPKKANNS